MFERAAIDKTPTKSEGIARNVQDLPGPKTLPIAGNLIGLDMHTLHLQLEQWCDQYGPWFNIKLGPERFTVMGRPESIQQVLKQRPEHFSRIRTIKSVFKELGIHGVFSMEGREWKACRKTTVRGLDARHLQRFYPTIIKTVHRLKNRWQDQMSQNQPIAVREDMMKMTVDITTALTMGYDINTLENDQLEFQIHLKRVFPILWKRLNAPFPYWRYIKLPADRNLEYSLEVIRNHVFTFISQARQKLAEQSDVMPQPGNFLESLLIQNDLNGDTSDESLFGSIITMLLAGEDTTAYTLCWIIYYLSIYPDLLAALRLELKEGIKEHEKPDREELDKLPLMDAIIQETMRLKPVAPLLYLTCLQDTQIDDVIIPRGNSLITLNEYAGKRNRWFNDAETFNPQRWLNPEQHQPHSPEVLIPFGSGPRFCPGRQLALMEIKASIAMICHCFDWQLITPAEKIHEELSFVVQPSAYSIQLKPLTGNT